MSRIYSNYEYLVSEKEYIKTQRLLKKIKILSKSVNKIKLLGNGEVSEKFDIEVDYSSLSAKEKIEKAGGQITVKNQSK